MLQLGATIKGHPACAGGRLGAMTHREHLAQADRFIAECKNRIARQREIIATAYEKGHRTDIPGMAVSGPLSGVRRPKNARTARSRGENAASYRGEGAACVLSVAPGVWWAEDRAGEAP